MKKLLLIAGLLGAGHRTLAQNRHTVFKDSAGALTTFIDHWGSTLEGRFKSVYDKKANTRRLVPMSAAEFAQEQAVTAGRIVVTKKLGQPLPAFRATDYAGKVFDSSQLRGKVLVLNFWFVGCGPCEMERVSLNKLHAAHQADSSVVFLSLVRSRREVAEKFLADSPFRYPVASFDAALEQQLRPGAFPTNLVIDRQGRYAFESIGAGVGSTALLEAAIVRAAQGRK